MSRQSTALDLTVVSNGLSLHETGVDVRLLQELEGLRIQRRHLGRCDAFALALGFGFATGTTTERGRSRINDVITLSSSKQEPTGQGQQPQPKAGRAEG